MKEDYSIYDFDHGLTHLYTYGLKMDLTMDYFDIIDHNIKGNDFEHGSGGKYDNV